MKRALLVGIDDYPGSPLSGCVNDAKAMKDILSRNEDGSPNFHCRLLTSTDSDVTRSALKQSINELFEHQADVALLYFSGHGTINNLGGYLVTVDAELYDEGVKMDDVLNLANASESTIGEAVIVLDCCHSGALGNPPEIRNNQAVIREGISILTASRSSQVAMEIDGQGVLTSLICDALDGGAADVCGNVTVASVYAYVDQALGAWDQRPLFKSHVSRFVPIRKCNPEIELPTLRLLAEYFKNPED
ncbi:MAG: caspase family protein, partial [bacterium]|nr:caspase family protein [bacterium]